MKAKSQEKVTTKVKREFKISKMGHMQNYGKEECTNIPKCVHIGGPCYAVLSAIAYMQADFLVQNSRIRETCSVH